MPAAQYEYQNFVAGAVNTPNATEGIIATTKPVASPYAGCSFGVQFSGTFTAGASTTSVTFRIRQDSLTGTAILTDALVLIAAGTIAKVTFCTIDALRADVAGAVWVLTALQNAGTAPGAIINAWSSVTAPV